MASQLNVGLAQIDCRLGDLQTNVERHLEWIGNARRQDVDLLVFPELSLTGYRLLHLTSHVALRVTDTGLLHDLAAAAGEMGVVVGLVEEGDDGALYNSAVLLRSGHVRHVHRKLYLPTYGIFQEGRFFAPGRQLRRTPIDGSSLGLLICEDLWHPDLARRLSVAGTKILAVLSAGPGRVGPGPVPESQETWECLTRSTALVNTAWVIYCNRVGWEEGSFYGGGSHIVHPNGRITGRAEGFDEQLLIGRIDLQEVDRVRWKLPLLQAHRRDIEEPT